MFDRLLRTLSAGLVVLVTGVVAVAAEPEGWATAYRQGPLSAEQTGQFMKELARFVFDNHLKKNPESPQRGMVYEYLDVGRKGQFDQFVQGEGLDTMHDGAWLAAAMVNAYRATGDPFYKEFLTRWQLPFYLKMLNHSDELFTARRNDARPGATPWGKPWAFQEGEKGFVPYFWDDGGSVSLERRGSKQPLGIRPCVDHLAGKPNPKFLLDGYSQGMSNHMSQDLGVMLQLAWLLLKDSDDPADQKLARQTAEAARNLHECRMRHFGRVPMCVAPAALACGDAELMRHVPPPDAPRYWTPDNHYVRAMLAAEPDRRYSLPGFADDQQYRYYYGIARSAGRLPRPLAFKTIYDAYTEPLLYRSYCDDGPPPPGINRFDLHTFYCRNGRHEDYRSDRKGPFAGPRPIGSRMGPQNMICCGWALQMLRAYPGIWEERYRRDFAGDLRVEIIDPPPGSAKSEVSYVSARLGEADVAIGSTRNAMLLRGQFASDTLVVKIFSRPDGQGSHAVVTLKQDGTKTAANDRGESLVMEAELAPDATQGRLGFQARIPYSVAKKQKPWLNGIEHGRYSISVGKSVRNFYLASSESQVRAWLTYELSGGLGTWQAIFREKGYIPTGLGTTSRWKNISDTGGYAHLISAAAQWLLCLEGKSDWQIHHVPEIEKPK